MKSSDSTSEPASPPRLNPWVFWPPFLLLLAAIILNFVGPDQKVDGVIEPGWFSSTVKAANGWILEYFGWLFTLCALLSVSLCIYICFSSFGKVRIGGPDARPLISRRNWFAITICTTIAIGILFWSTAEPVFHFLDPPASLGVEPGTSEAATFALSTMFLHWSFTPYAIYCVVSLTFAFAFFNMREPFSLGSTLSPILGKRVHGSLSNVIDAVCLYALVAGMAAALGAGILMIGGGLEQLLGWESSKFQWGVVTLAIVATFVVSSATGLMKGIRILSDINTKLLFGLVLLPLFLGWGGVILSNTGPALLDYAWHFVPRHLDFAPEEWGRQWTVFYWAVWLAWAPITACFLGRIAYGRTVREFMLVNFIYPSLFGIFWMAVFSSTAMDLQMTGQADLASLVDANQPEKVSFAVFETFPGAQWIISFYLLSAFVCFVTSSDSNMSAMASISSTGISPERPEGNLWLKITWGGTVGMVSWIMISFAGGVDGIKILSNLGGFPAALLQLLVIASLVRILWKHEELENLQGDDRSG